ncbi:hypothetical protein HCN44_007713 [Aphidius gifuensis]|uniref:sn-1-specific diacylglycerol lipase n=1 Tax=Aphidius gifuensis TaxID=684658 RepID=A0A835CMB7_APHGI|nr:diacylglycerol lipase-alpha-like [Aphidius gifuensis]KAF7988219.1 hypothetical protein HCN44_007713 [Aphidius gifuensis]
MPSLVAFGRRWQIGSDDLLVPCLQLALGHLIQAVGLGLFLGIVNWDKSIFCEILLWKYVLVYLGLFIISFIIEFAICILATRGSILDTTARSPIKFLLYIKLFLMLIEIGCLCAGLIWILSYYDTCPINYSMKKSMSGFVLCNGVIVFVVLMIIWCIYDPAGKTWVESTKYKKDFEINSQLTDRDWRHGKVKKAYHDRWTQRCSLLFCCFGECKTERDSFTDISHLLNDIFLHLDVVPSDVVAGLVLLREFQMIERKLIVQQQDNDVFEFLSGVPITPMTKFLSLTNNDDTRHLKNVIHYMHFALAAYGGSPLLDDHILQPCKIGTKCCCLMNNNKKTNNKYNNTNNNNNNNNMNINDNDNDNDSNDDNFDYDDDGDICDCEYSVFHKMVQLGNIVIVHREFSVGIGKTPFFVALDYIKKQIVISIRGTMSMVDIITDLDGEPVVLPLLEKKDDWLAHKMMLQAAEYIKNNLIDNCVLSKAFNKDLTRQTNTFGLTLVGHSLGAGTASILAILLRQDYPNLICYSYAPPGGLLSMPAQIYTQKFIISTILGKDFVPRMGLRQMECLRADVMNALRQSADPKWKTICSVMCCGCNSKPTAITKLENGGCIVEYHKNKNQARLLVPIDTVIIKPRHLPLYPPGKIIHVVRKYPNDQDEDDEKKQKMTKTTPPPLYLALWAGPCDFDEVLISPAMIQDHRPDHMLEILNKFKMA